MNEAAYRRFSNFYSDQHRSLWRYLIRLGATGTLAEDLVQDAFVRWSLSRAAEWERGRSRAYLFTIATRLLTDWWRRQRREISWDEAGELPLSYEIADSPLFRSGAWKSLTSRQQQLLWLAYVEEFSHAEIGAICGVSQGSVRVLLSRAREVLSRQIKTEEPVDGT
jgi:RNA polymerase sigma-70 factor (ECF subfamily)